MLWQRLLETPDVEEMAGCAAVAAAHYAGIRASLPQIRWKRKLRFAGAAEFCAVGVAYSTEFRVFRPVRPGIGVGQVVAQFV